MAFDFPPAKSNGRISNWQGSVRGYANIGQTLSTSLNGRLWNVRLHQSALAPENLITLAHFSVSSAMNLPKSEDEPGNTAAPRSANRAFNLGSARPALISLLSLSTISAGVSLGAPMPCSALAS